MKARPIPERLLCYWFCWNKSSSFGPIWMSFLVSTCFWAGFLSGLLIRSIGVCVADLPVMTAYGMSLGNYFALRVIFYPGYRWWRLMCQNANLRPNILCIFEDETLFVAKIQKNHFATCIIFFLYINLNILRIYPTCLWFMAFQRNGSAIAVIEGSLKNEDWRLNLNRN